MESDLSRRDFLRSAAKTTAGLSSLSGISFLTHPERVLGANDRLRVAVCGLHGRGKDHLAVFSRLSDVEIAALCQLHGRLIHEDDAAVGGRTDWVGRDEKDVELFGTRIELLAGLASTGG